MASARNTDGCFETASRNRLFRFSWEGVRGVDAAFATGFNFFKEWIVGV
jgi:hypothetical protein